LIKHTIRSCDLAVEMSRMDWSRRCELRSRRLCARIALVWAWNLPEEYREELQVHSDRLKEAIRRLQRFREAAHGERGGVQDRVTVSGTFRKANRSEELGEKAAIIQFPEGHKPARRRKKSKNIECSARVLRMTMR
jgi:hypothetical protein